MEKEYESARNIKLETAYEKFESLTEDDVDTVPEPEIDGTASKLDSFICTVNKPLFFVLFVINVAIMLYAVSYNNIGTWVAYVGCLAEMLITNLGLFYLCYKIKLSKGKLKVRKVKVWEKILLFGGAILLGLVVSIGLAFYQVNNFANNMNGYAIPNSIDISPDEDIEVDSNEATETTSFSEEDILKELSGEEKA